MIMELRKKSQITIPKEMIVICGLKEGDKLEITIQNGALNIIPVVVYLKKYIEELRNEILDDKKIKVNKQPVFNILKGLFKQLNI